MGGGAAPRAVERRGHLDDGARGDGAAAEVRRRRSAPDGLPESGGPAEEDPEGLWARAGAREGLRNERSEAVLERREEAEGPLFTSAWIHRGLRAGPGEERSVRFWGGCVSYVRRSRPRTG